MIGLMFGGLLSPGSSESSNDADPSGTDAGHDVIDSDSYHYHFVLDVNIPGSRRRSLMSTYTPQEGDKPTGIEADDRFPSAVRDQFRTTAANVLTDMDAELLALRVNGETTPAQAHLAFATPHRLDAHRFTSRLQRVLENAYADLYPDERSLSVSRVQYRSLSLPIDDKLPLPSKALLDEMEAGALDTLATKHDVNGNSRREQTDGLLILRAIDEQHDNQPTE